MDIMITKPIPREAMWGGTTLSNYFHYEDFPPTTGQAWAFSMQEGNANRVVEGMHSGELFSTIWEEHPEYFQSHFQKFPFIVGLVAPEQPLSVQVHPGKEYAEKHGLPSGKNEAWYFIEAKDNAHLIYGTNAENPHQLREWIEHEKWSEIVRDIPIHKDDFIYVPAGLLHAMQEDVVAYEVQEATDVTYRFYDYDRKDKKGNGRELHLAQAEECTTIFEIPKQETPIEETIPNGKCITYINNESFKIQKYCFTSETVFTSTQYMLVTVIKGEGTVNEHPVKKGTNFFIPVNMKDFFIRGNMEWLVTTEGKAV